ncbi:hypothetical protein AgCh_034205 [Apium graveolens]
MQMFLRSMNPTKYDAVLFKYLIRSRSGGTDVPSESPPSRKIKKAKRKSVRALYAKVKSRSFKVNDLVLRVAVASMPSKQSKISAPREGPYRVAKITSSGTYRPSHFDETPVINDGNAINLKQFNP